MDRKQWNRPSKWILVGVLLVGIAAPIAFVLARTIQTLPMAGGTLWLPDLRLPFPTTPSALLGISLSEWLTRITVGLVYFGVVLVYYGLLVLIAVGFGFAAAGTGRVAKGITRADLRDLDADLRRVAGAALTLLGSPPVLIGTLVLAGIGLVFLSPLQQLALEVVLVLLISAVGVALLGGLAVGAYTTSPNDFVDVIVVTPLVLTALLLPPVTAALIAPSLGPMARHASTDIAIWILDTVLAVGGVNAFLRRTFQLEGAAYVAMWGGIYVVTGWVIGVLGVLVLRVKARRGTDAVTRG